MLAVKPKSVIRSHKGHFCLRSNALQASYSLLPASCLLPCLDVARYAFNRAENNLQDTSEQSA